MDSIPRSTFIELIRFQVPVPLHRRGLFFFNIPGYLTARTELFSYKEGLVANCLSQVKRDMQKILPESIFRFRRRYFKAFTM